MLTSAKFQEQSLIGGGLEQIACVWSESKLFYVLTMGVMEHFRNVGIGAAMLKQVSVSVTAPAMK